MSSFCNLCGSSLERQRFIYLRPLGQLTVCKRCELWAPRCVVCGAPLARQGRANSSESGSEQCPYCAMGQAVCSSCGQAVGERGYGRTGEYEIFCAACFNQRERCLSCGRPVAGKIWQLAAGRRLCDRCHQSSVVDDREAHVLFDQVIRWVFEDLGLRVFRRPALALVEGSELDKLTAAIPSPLRHGQSHLLGVFQRHGRERTIWIQRGLPALAMVKVIAHEYGHGWQAENAPFLSDQELAEGFCEWLSYQIFGLMDSPIEQRRMRAAASFYGDALRRILAVEANEGRAGVIAALRRVHPQPYISH